VIGFSHPATPVDAGDGQSEMIIQEEASEGLGEEAQHSGLILLEGRRFDINQWKNLSHCRTGRCQVIGRY
jgi:hypothetical protein